MKRLPHDRYTSDESRAHNTAKVQLQFVIDKIDYLRTVDKQGTMERAARSMLKSLEQNSELHPNSLSYADKIYEATMKGMNLPAVDTHIDKKRKGLRFG